MKTRLAVCAWFVLVLCGCGDDSVGAEPDAAAPDVDSGGTPDVDSGGTPFEAQPSCADDDDCGSEACVRFGASGPSACRPEPMAPRACMPDMLPEDCCSDDDCTQGRCLTVVTSPVQCSPTAGFDSRNRCVADECTSDGDCASDSACAPDGFDNGRVCLAAACRSDADCAEEPGGVCLVLEGGCCGMAIGGGPSRPAQLACAYPSDGCQTDADCDSGQWCTASSGRAHCTTDC